MRRAYLASRQLNGLGLNVPNHGARLTDSIALPPAADPAPDWAAVAGDIVCPLCDYNLRGLAEPRCPECGYRFQWRDLLDSKRREHPYIFEHHPQRNVWSFVRTAIGGLRPWKFWSSLRPDQTSRPKRLVMYWGMSMLIVLSLMVVACTALYADETARHNASRILLLPARGTALRLPRGAYLTRPVAPRSYLDWNAFRHSFVYEGPPFLVFWVACLAWPWLTLAILMIFRVSMRRAKVKTVHVLRSVLYSSDAFIWPALLLTATLSTHAILMAAGKIDRSYSELFPTIALGIAILCLLPAVKLWAAYQQYLRFRQALMTIISSQLIFVLSVLAANVIITGN
jgi:hypothetical protein